eukprot:3683060-Amphidinium_carterae.1
MALNHRIGFPQRRPTCAIPMKPHHQATCMYDALWDHAAANANSLIQTQTTEDQKCNSMSTVI